MLNLNGGAGRGATRDWEAATLEEGTLETVGGGVLFSGRWCDTRYDTQASLASMILPEQQLLLV